MEPAFTRKPVEIINIGSLLGEIAGAIAAFGFFFATGFSFQRVLGKEFGDVVTISISIFLAYIISHFTFRRRCLIDLTSGTAKCYYTFIGTLGFMRLSFPAEYLARVSLCKGELRVESQDGKKIVICSVPILEQSRVTRIVRKWVSQLPNSPGRDGYEQSINSRVRT